MARTTELSIGELQRLIARRQRDLATYYKQRETLEKQLAKVNQQIASIEGGASGGDGAAAAPARGRGRGRGPGRPRGSGRGQRPDNAMSLPDTIAKVLEKAGESMGVGDITEAVLRTGYRSNSANFRSIVNQALIKDTRFEQEVRGAYRLRKQS